jgi:hypothetical protein
MPTSTYKRLGAAQGNGVIGTAADIYTCPTATAAVISTISICNTASTAATYSLGISTASATYQAAGFIVYQASIAGNDTVGLTFGTTMDATNKFLVASSSASTVSFGVFGSEIA